MDITTLAAAKAYTDKRISESGGSSLIAGDLLEIKDGVVRCTLGDVISGELKEEFEEIYGTHTLEMTNEEGPLYMSMIPMNEYGLPSVGDILEVAFTPFGETTPTNFTIETIPFIVEDGEVYIWSAGCNATCTREMEFTVIDDTKPAIFLVFTYNDGNLDAPAMMLVSSTDYTGATLAIGAKTITDTRKYVLLPDTALGLGREIMTEVDEEILNAEIPEMENIETAYLGIVENVYAELFVGDTINANITLPNESSSTTLISEITEFVIAEGMSMLIASFNCILSMSEETGAPIVTKLDDSLPAFVVMFMLSDGNSAIQIISADDYSGASIVVSKKAVIKTNVKLPNEALNFDSEPTEGSTNLVNSGDLFNILGDIKTVIADINNLVGGAS